jgi:hypothetical protein
VGGEVGEVGRRKRATVMHVCVCVCMLAFVRACVRACVLACMGAFVLSTCVRAGWYAACAAETDSSCTNLVRVALPGPLTECSLDFVEGRACADAQFLVRVHERGFPKKRSSIACWLLAGPAKG